MFGINYFFEIPIFRCSFDQWVREKESKKASLSKYYKDSSQTNLEEKFYDDLAYRSMDREFLSYFYSELVGMIKLYITGNQIRTELWFIKNRVSKNLKNKKWHLYSNKFIPEISVNKSHTNKQIFDLIFKKLRNESKKGKLKKCSVDFECFENSGAFIDYLSLIDVKQN